MKIPIATVFAVVLILGGIAANVIVSTSDSESGNSEESFLASAFDAVGGSADADLAAEHMFADAFQIAESDEGTAGFVIVDSEAALNASNPLSTILPTRDGLIIYKIQKGDTLSKIAANFGISLNTIFWANQNIKNTIRPGQEIVILPVSGVLHYVEEGETLNAIAELYDVPVEKIRRFNRGAAMARAGSTVVIPGAKPKKGLATASLSDLPSMPGYFIIPTTGWNWGRLHYYNAVDIANACGTPVYAAAEGLVIAEYSYGWNGGWGHYLDIEHPNGVITRYSHTQKNIVSVGDYVSQGDLIAYVGNTGNTHGPTGCHLHFEVRGAKNPFSK